MIWRRHVRSVLSILVGTIILSCSFAASAAYGQSGLRSLHAIGTGGSASPLFSPTAALYSNPANVGVGEREASFEIRLLDIQSHAGGDLLQFGHYNETLASGRHLPSSEVDQHLDSWFGGQERSVAAHAAVVPLSVSYQPAGAQWALGGGVRIRGMSTTSVNRGLFDLLLKGTGTERTVPVDGRYSALSSVDITGAFSYTFSSTPLTVGVAPRFIIGTGFADGRLESEVTVAEEVITHTFDYTARAAGPASSQLYDSYDVFGASPMPDQSSLGVGMSGYGGGVDIGATYEMYSDVFVSMSVTDLGVIQWTSHPQTVTPVNNEFRFEGIELDMERLKNEFEGDVLDYAKNQVDSLARSVYREVDRDRSGFATRMPTTLQAGGTWREGRYTLTGGVALGLNSSVGAISSSPSVHAGGEVRLGPVPLQAGVRVGGANAIAFAGGIGIHVSGVRFDVGGSLTPSTSLLGAGARYAVDVSLTTVQF